MLLPSPCSLCNRAWPIWTTSQAPLLPSTGRDWREGLEGFLPTFLPDLVMDFQYSLCRPVPLPLTQPSLHSRTSLPFLTPLCLGQQQFPTVSDSWVSWHFLSVFLTLPKFLWIDFSWHWYNIPGERAFYFLLGSWLAFFSRIFIVYKMMDLDII